MKRMMAGCLSLIGGAVIGLVLGAFGCAAAMSLAGGGRSHNDMFTWMFATVLCGVVGGIAAPPLSSRILGILERRRAARAGGAMAPAFPRAFVLYLLGAFGALFSAGTLLYYSYALAELPPAAGGPRSDISGEIRARVTLIAGLLATAAALLLYVAALRTEAVRERKGRPPGP